MRCEYCRNEGHGVRNCPHLASHLIDPNPKFNSLRSFIRMMQRHGVDVEPRVPSPQPAPQEGDHG
jgi:hypothetical protein